MHSSLASSESTDASLTPGAPRALGTPIPHETVDSARPGIGPRTGRAHFYPDATDAEWNDWRWQFRHRITRLEELERFVNIPGAERALRADVLRDFRMGITPYYMSLVDADDPADPILRQVAPIVEEYVHRDIGEEDPLGEEQYSPVPGITHRYPDRVLMVISNSCAIYCRYCTRKRIMYEDAVPEVEIDRMVEYIARTPAVRDVIVSGGDPLTYSTRKLESILSKLRAVPHLEIIRIGSRVPVSLPQRIDDELCAMLAKQHPLWINVHFNHPRELTADAAAACDKLSRAGIPLNNQSVMLKGINDDVPTMRALCTGLMKLRVRPYYVYQCDQVRGAEHFRTPVSKGIEVIEGLRGHISGLAVPTFVIDAPGGGGKVPVMPQYLLQHDTKNQRVLLRNFQDRVFVYHEPTGRARPLGERSGELAMPQAAPATPLGDDVTNGGAAHAAKRETAPSTPTSNGTGSNGNGRAASNGGNGRANGSAKTGTPRLGPDGKPIVGKSRWVHRGHSREERARKAKES